MLFVPNGFIVQEFVHPDIYAELKDSCWRLIDNRLLWTMQEIRKRFGKPVMVNNWHKDGDFKYRGLRPFECSVGSKWSDHKFGRGVDFDVAGKTAEEVRQDILKNQKTVDAYKHITVIEDNVTWVHLGFRNWSGGILVVSP